MTDAMIDKMQNYYGIAMRANVGNLKAMKNAILASFFHCDSSESHPFHQYCPVGPESWCKYQQVQNSYKYGYGLPNPLIRGSVTMGFLKSVFMARLKIKTSP